MFELKVLKYESSFINIEFKDIEGWTITNPLNLKMKDKIIKSTSIYEKN